MDQLLCVESHNIVVLNEVVCGWLIKVAIPRWVLSGFYKLDLLKIRCETFVNLLNICFYISMLFLTLILK